MVINHLRNRMILQVAVFVFFVPVDIVEFIEVGNVLAVANTRLIATYLQIVFWQRNLGPVMKSAYLDVPGSW